MYIITRENPTNKVSGLTHPMFWTGEHWSWLEKQAKEYGSEAEAFDVAAKIVPLLIFFTSLKVELHQFSLEHYKNWEGHDWYRVIRDTSKSEVGCLGFSHSPIFGDGWSIHLYVGKPESANHKASGFPLFSEAIKAAEDFLGGGIKFGSNLVER